MGFNQSTQAMWFGSPNGYLLPTYLPETQKIHNFRHPDDLLTEL